MDDVDTGVMPSKGPNSPFSVGTRTLIARTCIKCGELADGDSFPILKIGRRRVCHRCHNRQKKQDRIERGIGVPSNRPPEELQTKKRQQWSAEDDQYLRDHITTQSYEEIAVHLGRSIRAVYKRRDILGLTVVRKSHRVAKPWRIEQ